MITITTVEDRTHEIGRDIFRRISRERRSVLSPDIESRIMEWTMRDEKLRVQLFRFVDVLPTLKTSQDVAAHIREYFGDADGRLPVVGHWGVELASSNRLAASAAAMAAKVVTGRMARRFIAGANIREAISAIRALRSRKMAFSLDILGEVAVSESEAESYQTQYLNAIAQISERAAGWEVVPLLDTAARRPIPRVNVSVKLSALYSQWEPADPESATAAVKVRLRPILTLARKLGAFINFDMEHYEIKDLTLKIFREVLMEPDYHDWEDVGIAIQAYLRDSEEDAQNLIEWVEERGTPITVRLVRGAYWDYETVIAEQRRWPVPVYTEKHETDLNYERVTRLLLENYPTIHTAIATHNVRSIAYAIALSESLELPKGAIEVQMLYGLGDPIKRTVVDLGERLRVYTPYGELIPGMSYLVRRLLENTANESFLRQGLFEHVSEEELLRNPATIAPAEEPAPAAKPKRVFANEPERDYSRAEYREKMVHALADVRDKFRMIYPLIIAGREFTTDKEIVSLNPSAPSEVVGRVASATKKEAQMAVEAAKKAFPMWRDTPARERVEYLFRAAEIMREERDDLAAWEVYEEGKGWREADADICETIDYLNYYGLRMIELGVPKRLGHVPGEVNDYFYQPKGVAAVIPPWNFPMAICAGMSAAAVVTGNTAIIKPASQSPIVAAKFVDILQRAGLPDGVVNFVPGPGEEVGEYLVQHPDIDIIAFTGSRRVGTRINQLAAEVQPGQDHLKRVIAEMGGKNALIIDSDADLDEAVLGTIASAFGYQGQKCSAASRIIVLDPVHDRFLDRLTEAAKSLKIGPADDPENFMGPVIDEAAMRKIQHYIEVGKSEGRLVLERNMTELSDGYFIGPVIFADVQPTATIAQEEIFGPVVSVIRAGDFGEALEIAMGTDYCLTGGVYSRSPANIARARRDFRVGNLYINRKITGAIVGRQPFGGFKMSGIGSKAGGPDYLLQFMEPRTVTENTLRRGFAPAEGE